MPVTSTVPSPAVLAAYHGPPAFGWPSAAGRWTFDPALVVFAALAVGGYLLAVARVRRAGGRWPVARTLSFLVPGIGLAVLAGLWWVGVYARVLFWDFTVQVILLLLVAPIFLAFGRPLTLVALGGGRPGRFVDRVRASGPFRVASHPAFGPLLVPVVVCAVYFTGLLATAQRDAAVAEIIQIALLLTGFVVALPLAGEDAGTSTTSLAIAGGMFFGVLELLLDAVPGIFVRLRHGLLAPGYYASLHRPWGPSPLNDQHVGGTILWTVAEVVDLPFLVLLVRRWIKVDAQEAARVDRELDALALAQPALTGSPSADGESAGAVAAEEAERTRPWWETDADYFGGSRAAQFRRAGAERNRTEPS
ncbi:cytochrome c oxidase assembly protein [Frankia sp. AgB1.9]|uniref:cytochrome c oxidase assembly protein n=1 Tax=unclassified Frankia TaxID=2632575 RepID=UPI0019349759|nr:MULTISPECIES: cytochrome c oxidase assembly protein [unclassified Frankia]MBL7490035.1 cytochrome c oxidase assembly protein [Frankia sp. AgW1.1]MBL7551348.1 cytochrome c oxidase assembly protein [Frankia sp. AgB1.9]MBL7624167.1 cytochrome c oxidase assembly protein [Frankia sp. AgB1.8]